MLGCIRKKHIINYQRLAVDKNKKNILFFYKPSFSSSFRKGSELTNDPTYCSTLCKAVCLCKIHSSQNKHNI